MYARVYMRVCVCACVCVCVFVCKYVVYKCVRMLCECACFRTEKEQQREYVFGRERAHACTIQRVHVCLQMCM